MVYQLLPDVPRTIFRPAIVLGDSRRPETTQFDMVQAFSVLASLPVLPLKPTDRIDIVPADYVGKAIVAIHQKDTPKYPRYHLSSGTGSQTYRELTDALGRLAKRIIQNICPRTGQNSAALSPAPSIVLAVPQKK